jgi:selenocysteine lyase/cysteine desulfurase
MSFAIDDIRAEFPALALTDAGRRRIYLDNPAGTQVPRAVADAVSHCLLESNANLGGFFTTVRTRRWRIFSGRRRRKSSLAPT